MSLYYIVKDVVCDYGVFECDTEKKTHELKEICNSYYNAQLICDILNADLKHKVYKPIEKDMLFYVRKYSIMHNDYILVIYRAKTTDIYHTMGEIKARSLEQVKRIDWNDYSPERAKYWEEHGYEIYDWVDIHSKGEIQ